MSYYTKYSIDDQFDIAPDYDPGYSLSDEALHELYDEMLNESYGDAVVAGMAYGTSYALREIDPIAYRTGFHDWLDAEIQDGNIVEL